MAVIGTCSRCGGPVVMAEMSLYPVAHCEVCGSIASGLYGPTIQTQPPPPVITQRIDIQLGGVKKKD